MVIPTAAATNVTASTPAATAAAAGGPPMPPDNMVQQDGLKLELFPQQHRLCMAEPLMLPLLLLLLLLRAFLIVGWV